jgi:hypothetical protein
MTYNVVDRSLLLFAGRTACGHGVCLTNDTWKFSAGTWSNVSSVVSPSSRDGAALAFDGRFGAPVLFGGNFGGNQTWAFVNGSWAPLHPPRSPSPRTHAYLCYDRGDGYLLLFGGVTARGHLLNGTWKLA